MAKNKQQKAQAIAEYVSKIKNAKAMYFVKPTALKGAETVRIKNELFDHNATFNVVKNTLFLRAVKESDIAINELEDVFTAGEHAVVFANGDQCSPMKVIKTFMGDVADKIQVLAGILDGKWVNKASVMDIADLPDYNTMMSRTLATFNGVTTNFVRANANSIERLLNVLNAYKDTK